MSHSVHLGGTNFILCYWLLTNLAECFNETIHSLKSRLTLPRPSASSSLRQALLQEWEMGVGMWGGSSGWNSRPNYSFLLHLPPLTSGTTQYGSPGYNHALPELRSGCSINQRVSVRLYLQYEHHAESAVQSAWWKNVRTSVTFACTDYSFSEMHRELHLSWCIPSNESFTVFFPCFITPSSFSLAEKVVGAFKTPSHESFGPYIFIAEVRPRRAFLPPHSNSHTSS